MSARIALARRALNELDRRFLEPRSGIVLDYVPDDGTIDLPDAADLTEARPNALAWWTPGENGAFFTGLYLAALVRAAARDPEDQTLTARAAAAAATVERLASVGSRPGFVARMVAADGTSHPPLGSDDQTFPALFGLWRYVRSGLAAPERAAELSALVLRVIRALRDIGWSLPNDGALTWGFRGSFAPGVFVSAARLLLVHRIAADLDPGSGDEWMALYRAKLEEQPPESDGPTRRELLRLGAGYGPIGSPWSYPHHPPFWTSGSAQLALAALLELEEEPAVRDDFAAGLAINAEAALPHVQLLRWDDAWSALPFEGRWRELMERWEPQHTPADAVRVGQHQSALWENRTPRKFIEDTFVRAPAWAALIASVSPGGADDTLDTALAGAASRFTFSAPATSGFLPLALL